MTSGSLLTHPSLPGTFQVLKLKASCPRTLLSSGQAGTVSHSSVVEWDGSGSTDRVTNISGMSVVASGWGNQHFYPEGGSENCYDLFGANLAICMRSKKK